MKKKYSILVVDDETGMREGVARILKPFGYEVFIAGDGKEASEIIEKETFDLALIDLKLPDTDGLTILDEILHKDPLVVCIIITAYATLDTAVSATKRGAFDYLAKPFTKDELLVIIDKALDRRDIIVEADKLRKERDRSLLELSHEQTRFKTIISCMTDGVIVTNRDNGIVLFNNAGSKFLDGYMDMEPGAPIADHIKHPDISEMISKAGEEGGNTHMQGKEIKQGDATWLANCGVLRDEEGEFLGTVTVFRDITEMKEVEKIKQRFISLVAHELKAPVAAIRGYLDIILKKAAGNDSAVYDNMMVRAKERADGLLDLIKDLLDMSRIDARKVERHIVPVRLADYIESNLEFLKFEIENRKITVKNNAAGLNLVVMADADELNRIITNLLSNAVKYNKDEGEIIIDAAKKGEMITFSIADTGIGMNEEDQSRLFEDFFRANNPQTRKQPGTGLGLAITRRMIESNNGRVEFESAVGKGTKFSIILPAGYDI
ncbi:MAG: response regulator [Firmicutes bacterium]|nr:response regulator [Bacillota bacterium]